MAISSSRPPSDALQAATFASVLMLLSVTALSTGAGASVLTLFDGPACTGNVQAFSDLSVCHNITISVGGMHFAPNGDSASALLYTSADCSVGSLVGVLGGAARAVGGLLSDPANASGDATGFVRDLTGALGGIAGGPVAKDGSWLLCSGSLTTFQSFKLQAGNK